MIRVKTETETADEQAGFPPQGACDQASLQKMWENHSIPISTKTRLVKALVWPVSQRTAVKAGHSERMKKYVFTTLR